MAAARADGERNVRAVSVESGSALPASERVSRRGCASRGQRRGSRAGPRRGGGFVLPGDAVRRGERCVPSAGLVSRVPGVTETAAGQR